MIRVVVADDSATARFLLRAVLEAEGDLRVVAEAHDGAEAVDLVERHKPDLVIMDVHMPVLDGLEATKQIMVRAPTPIIIVSAVTRRDVDLSLSATQAGALLALPKPENVGGSSFEERAAELRAMARAMAHVKVVRHWSSHVNPVSQPVPRPRRQAMEAPQVIAIAASTGGPPALRRMLMDLPRTLPLPVLVVQHIARDFSAGFAEWLAASCALRVKLAEDRERLSEGVVYIAPDDAHLGVTREGRVALSRDPPIAGFRPSATYMFASAGRAYGRHLLAVVLTGMGSDGAVGLEEAHAAGAYVIAQNETSSVVYGMAAEAVRRGAVDIELPIERIAERVLEIVSGGAHAG
ncbi:MAG TPA: chemotaxis-specific protein-glutamate methyltransferase CheB [Longimicrobiales bacterium]|nr:chemotaxis-specific protein-glutamate methyltransferase CheB [Longimicrobiales bacterium]